MPNKYYINDTTTPTIDLRSQIQKELRSLERKCNIRVANKETRFSDLKDNKNFYEHVEEEYEGALLLVFQKMKIRNYKEYKLLLGMFYHDFCLINNNEENDFYNEEKQIFEEFKSSVKNINDLLNQIETVPSYICDFVSSFEEFQKMPYFNKRKLFLDNKDLNDYLKKFFPYHYIEGFYYTCRYTKENIKILFDKNLKYNEEEAKKKSVSEISSTLHSLYYSDPDNYYDLMLPIIKEYYKNMLFKSKYYKVDNTNDELLNKIEKWDLEYVMAEIGENFTFQEILILELYDSIYNYTDTFKSEANSNYINNCKPKIKQKLKDIGGTSTYEF